MRYFQVKQLPNFLLASPILSLAFCSIVHYAKSNPENFFSLGFRAPIQDKNSASVFFTMNRGITFKHALVCDSLADIITVMSYCTSNHEWLSHVSIICKCAENCNLKAKKLVTKENPALPPEESKLSANQGYLSVAALPCIFHLGFMAATAFFVMHVQVWVSY